MNKFFIFKFFIFISLVIFTISCNVWSEPENFKVENNPVACFIEVTPECGGETYKVPMPSSYMEAALPKGLTVNIDPHTPFIVKFGDKIKKETLNSKNLIILEDSNVLPSDKYVIEYGKDENGNEDQSIMAISNSTGSWNPKATYVVILLNGIKSQNDLVFGKSKAWFMAISEFPLIDKDGKSVIEGLSDESAQTLQALRENLAPQLDLLTKLLKISRFDILLLWSFKFEKPVACFKETLDGCKNDQIPVPSDLMSMALPANTHLNISNKTKFSLKFSDPLDITTVKDNILILKQETNGVSVLTSDDFDISYDNELQDGVKDTSRIFILPKSKHWNFDASYLVIVKKGIKNHLQEEIFASSATFFAKMKDSLFTDEEMTKINPALEKIFENKLSDAQALEMLRRKYKDSLDAVESMANIGRDDIIMFWSVTFGENYIIPCFKASEFPGCEAATEAPLPSDFIMAYEYDADGNEVSHHLNLPVKDDDPMKELIEGINTLDGWSISKEFSLTLSNDLDMSTVNTNVMNIPNGEIPDLMVLKLGIDANGNPTATPTLIEATFNENWNTLKIKPLMRNWDESSKYLVVLTNGVKGKNGEKLVKSLTFSLMSEREPLLNEDGSPKYLALANYDADTLNLLEGARKQFDTAYKALELPLTEGGLGLDRDNIAMMWTVTTQTVTQDMKNIILGMKASENIPKNTFVIKTVIDNSEISTHYSNYLNSYWMQGGTYSFEHVSKIVEAQFLAPWMLTEQNVFDKNKLSGALQQSDFRQIPVLIAFPDEPQQVQNNNKVIIFQHGINDSKEEVLPILNTLTEKGYIVVSMDLPLHGERSLHPDIDLKDNFALNRNIPDGVPDDSGEGFLGLNIFGTRDLTRQAVIEQTILTANLKLVDFHNLNNDIKFSTIDNNNIKYFGFSLGTIIGNIFISVDDSIKSAVLNAAGGGLTNIIMNTKESISGSLFAVFEAMGMSKDSRELNDFMYLAQVVLDPADPINYSRSGLPVLIQKSLNDPVVANFTTDDLGIKLGLINPLTNTKNPALFKEYQVNDYDPGRLFWHSFTMINKDPDTTNQARTDLTNFLDAN